MHAEFNPDAFGNSATRFSNSNFWFSFTNSVKQARQKRKDVQQKIKLKSVERFSNYYITDLKVPFV